MSAGFSEPPPPTLAQHAARTLRLALPVMLSRAGIIVLVMVDTAMTGHAGTSQLAFYSIGIAPQLTMLLIGVGALLGTIVLTAQADGAGRSQECGQVWRLALAHGAGYGLLMLVLAFAGEQFLLAAGQPPELAVGGARVLLIFAWSLPAMLMYIATTLFLEGVNRPLPGLLVMLVANLLNAGLNWLLIYGNAGLPALGADGAALATTLVRWFMFLAIAGYVLLALDRRRYGIGGAIPYPSRLGRQLRRIGYPMALSQGLESSAFAALTLFAGLLGPLVVAAYQINISLISLVFMFALGFSTAASVRVGNAVGRRDPAGLRAAGWVAALLAVAVLACWSMVFLTLPERLVAVYSDDPAVIAAAAAALAVAAAALLPDGLQAVLMGALRGMADVWPATLLFLIAFWLIMLPAGYLLGVHWQQGAVGLVRAILLGTAVAAVLLALRFHRVSRRTAW